MSINSIRIIAGSTATFTCTIRVSKFVNDNDLNGLSLVNTTFSPSGGNMNTPSQNGRVFTVQYTITNVNTGNAGKYTCQSRVQHSDSNILTSYASRIITTLSVKCEYMLLVPCNLNNIIYN